MDKEKLAVTIRKIWKQKDSKTEGWNDVSAYVLENFVPTEKVQDREVDLQNLLNEHWEDVIKRDYISKEEHSKAILEISRLKAFPLFPQPSDIWQD